MQQNYPEWLLDKTPVFVRGDVRHFDPSERRMEDRKRIYTILLSKHSSISKIDEIINHFRNKYEGENWMGLGKRARQQLFIEGKGRCMWCKEKLHLSEFTIEHIKPRGEGGSDDWSNLGIAHRKCNNLRENVIINNTGYYNDEHDRKTTGTPQ